MSDPFETECFIELIRDRPSLWDVQCSDYANKTIKQRCWNEVYCIMEEDFENLPREVKEKKSAEILRRWKSLRNSFTRELAKQKSEDGSASSRKTYVYFDMLSFLKPSFNNTTSNLKHEVEDSQEESHLQPTSLPMDRSRKRQRSLDESEDPLRIPNETISLRLRKDDDDDKLFLLSLHSHLKSVPEDKKLLAKSDLIQVLIKYNTPQHTNRHFSQNSL